MRTARGYPVAYRGRPRTIGKPGGFQPRLPANDPRPPARVPRNIPPSVTRIGRGLPSGWAMGLRVGGRLAGRLLPIIGWGLLAYDAYQLWQWLKPGQTTSNGWELYKTCWNTAPLVGWWPLGPDCYYAQYKKKEAYNPAWETTRSYITQVQARNIGVWVRDSSYVWKNTYQDHNGQPPDVSDIQPETSHVAPPSVFQSPDDAPFIPTWIDPLSTPVNKPVPDVPKRIPSPASVPLNPWRSITEQTHRGEPSSPVAPKPLVGKVVPVDEVVLSTGMQPGTVIQSKPGYHVLRKPRRRDEKERKFKFKRFTLLDWVGEAADFADALYKALPEKYQKKGKVPMHEKLEAIWEHIDEATAEDIIREVLKSQQTDRNYGTVGQEAADSLQNNPYYTSPVGWQTGWAH